MTAHRSHIPFIAVSLFAAMTTACSQSPSNLDPTAGTPESGATATPAEIPTEDPVLCSSLVDEMTDSEQAGLLFMVGINAGTDSETAITYLDAINAGSAILLGDRQGLANIRTETEALSQANPGLLIAVDQEGGLVQRLQGEGFDTIPAATEQARMRDHELDADWRRYSTQLREAGVHYNLAPVADVVPAEQTSTNQPIGVLQRGYGSNPEIAADKIEAVITGMHHAEVLTSAKHFPGLGNVPQNTDFEIGYDPTSTRDTLALAPFEAAIEAGTDSVMVNSAIYQQIDPDNPAVFSSIIIDGLLREDLEFDGVVISDDLGVAASVQHVDPAERASRFFAAGGDLLITADPQLAEAMHSRVVDQMSHPAVALEVSASATRVMGMKARAGLADCTVQ